MKERKIRILTGNDDFFGQTRKPWVSMDVDKIIAVLRENDYDVEKNSFHEIVNRDCTVTDSIIFYTFSQKVNKRRYIDDVIHFLNDGSNFLVPSYDLFRCHENKGFQELYKRKKEVKSLPAYYLSGEEELSRYRIRYPVVYKNVEGSNARGVRLARNRAQLISIVRRNAPQKLTAKLDLLRRKHFRRKKRYAEYPDYSNRRDYHEYKKHIENQRNFILQEFVPNLHFDYRILVLYDKYYVTKRHVNTNDFRASGTKKFDFDFEPDPKLLEFAGDVFTAFDTPYLSMDICRQGETCYLLEFQALHFGISVFVKSKGCYRRKGAGWTFVPEKSDIETEIAHGLIEYLDDHFDFRTHDHRERS
jgi:hypothetical protein